ncbi:MarR family winged helix-turn-helix transcriptional regulator [Citricoccus sp. K5]|uniref:MarR family winged helix-turn-helix transcriptional regulator n=1 Tax=Citricoccus sp. K5 TaxID=2653135 RepID=UPI0012F1618F|nr:MarR family transcriptional regulator [Citricoccus sp. K5]VXB90244.1 hypothetical protein CITRIK5_70190 [Citricoccus sp. K5]
MTDEFEPTAQQDSTHRRPLLGLLLNAERGIRSYMDDILPAHSLSTPEYTALVILRNYGPMASSELARHTFVTPQAMGQIISSIEARNLVIRHQDPNHGRKLIADLTPEGADLVDACVDHLQVVEERFLGSLKHREREYFLDLLSECVDNLNSHRSGTAHRSRHLADGID